MDSSFPRGLSLGQHMAGSGMTTPQPGPGIREAFPGGTGQAAGGSTSLQVEVLRTTVTTTRASGKEPPANVGDIKDARSGRSPGGGHGNPLQYSCPENPQGQKSLAGYSPYRCKESDTTEQLGMHVGNRTEGNGLVYSEKNHKQDRRKGERAALQNYKDCKGG